MITVRTHSLKQPALVAITFLDFWADCLQENWLFACWEQNVWNTVAWKIWNRARVSHLACHTPPLNFPVSSPLEKSQNKINWSSWNHLVDLGQEIIDRCVQILPKTLQFLFQCKEMRVQAMLPSEVVLYWQLPASPSGHPLLNQASSGQCHTYGHILWDTNPAVTLKLI